MKSYRFERGGIELSRDPDYRPQVSITSFLPAVAVLPMVQHAGPPARILVYRGDEVREGQIVGRSDAPEGANVHAPIPGVVENVGAFVLPDGRPTQALVIRLRGSFEKLGRRSERFPWESLSATDLQRIVAEKGVVEMDGPGRSLAPLIAKARKSAAVLVVVNAVFDEPGEDADRSVLTERINAAAEGLGILVRAIGAKAGKGALIAVSVGEEAAAGKLAAACSSWGQKPDLVSVGTAFPQRRPRELIGALSRSEYYKGFMPAEPFIVSPSTLTAISDAVAYNSPVMERRVAVTGSAIKNPAVVRTRIGMRIGELLADRGGFSEEPRAIIVGSSFDGTSVANLDTPILKTTTAIRVLGSREMDGAKRSACIGCGNCRDVCPVGLDPERLFKLRRKGMDAEAEAEGALDCHGCGLCSAMCPAGIDLPSMIRRQILGREKR